MTEPEERVYVVIGNPTGPVGEMKSLPSTPANRGEFPDAPTIRAKDGQDAIDKIRDRYNSDQREPFFGAHDRFFFSGGDLEHILLESAGAVSGVFLKEDPHKVMPTQEVEKAVRDWCDASALLWEEAEGKAKALDSNTGPRLFAFNAVKPPGVVALTGYVGEYEGDPAVEHAHTVIDNRGDVVKDPDGRTGRRVTEEERVEALVVYPQKRYASDRAPDSDKTIILMAPETYYSHRVLADAAVVIDRDGVIVKNRQGIAGVEAAPDLLEDATPVFPDDSGPEARRKGREFHDQARKMAAQQRRDASQEPHLTVWDLPKEPWTPVQKLALTLSGAALAMALAALILTLVIVIT